MIVLDQHRAGEIGAVVHAAAAAHGVLLEEAPSRQRLASVDDDGPCPSHGLDEAVRERRDAGEVLHEVQRGALGGEQAARVAGEKEDGLVALCRHAVLGVDADLDALVEEAERGERERHPGNHAGLARDEPGAGAPRGEHGGERRDVLERGVFVERAPHQRNYGGLIQRKARPPELRRLEGRDAPRGMRRFVIRHSPGSTPGPACTGPPPMLTMRSMARRARAAMSSGTVMRCCIRFSDASTFGSVVTFM